MKRMLRVCLLLLAFLKVGAQENLDQNGWKTSVTSLLSANELQATRYEIATLGYNSYHWQPGGLVIIELFSKSYGTGYEKYILENGFGQGANHGSPALRLVDSHGANHLAKVTIGAPSDLNSSFADKINKALPIYLDIRYYAGYQVKLTYLQDKVNAVDNMNQIKVNTAPSGLPIEDFTVSNILDVPLTSSGNLMVVGNGNHYIKNGNVGIGTTTPKEKLSVNGNIRAHEIKVELGNWPDYVFASDYHLPTLEETEEHIKRKGYLPGIPSAVEVIANGVDLGKMNAMLLQKIEELTLYLIEQKKGQQAIQEEVKLLKLALDNSTYKK